MEQEQKRGGGLQPSCLEAEGRGEGSEEQELAISSHNWWWTRETGLPGLPQNWGSATLGCLLLCVDKETGAQRGSTLVSGLTAL